MKASSMHVHCVLTPILLLYFLPITLTLSFSAYSPPEKPGHNRRGVAYNDVSLVKLFEISDSHATWCYNWDSDTAATNTQFEFVPMLHSDRPEHLANWRAGAEKAAIGDLRWPTHLLGFNEPDNCIEGAGGSCMSADTAVATWREHMEPLKTIKNSMYFGSPAVSNGPVGLPWLKEFLEKCSGCNVDFINVHWYGSANSAAYFRKHIEDARQIAGGRPIWITEFKPFGSDQEIKDFLDDVLPWLDNSDDVHRYAYFMARDGDGLLIENGGLSDIGRHYISTDYGGTQDE